MADQVGTMPAEGTMGTSHAAVGFGAGLLGNVLGIVAVGRGWVGPRLAAGLMVGGGGLVALAGHAAGSGYLTASGIGIATAGAYSAVTQLAIAMYERRAQSAEAKSAPADAEATASTPSAEAKAQTAAEADERRNVAGSAQPAEAADAAQAADVADAHEHEHGGDCCHASSDMRPRYARVDEPTEPPEAGPIADAPAEIPPGSG